MLESVTSGRDSGFSEWLKSRPLPRGRRFAPHRPFLWFCSLSSLRCFPRARPSPPPSSISAYADAIKQSTIAERIAAMERYLAIVRAAAA